MVGRSTDELPTQGARDYIPLKVNASGVMPIIFAQAIMFPAFDHCPNGHGQLRNTEQLFDFPQQLEVNTVQPDIFHARCFVYLCLYSIDCKPKQYATYLKNQNSFIPV